MPTYQYVCTNPDDPHEFERVQSFTEPDVSECPVCGFPVRKRYGSVGVVFKGSGFYRNDSRNGSSGSDAAVKSEAGKSDGSKSDAAAAKSDSSASAKSDSSSSSAKPAKAAPAASPAAAP
jgi:putative FmdB family regulatory protein